MARHKRPLPGYVDIGLTNDEVDVIVEETIEAALNGPGGCGVAQPSIAEFLGIGRAAVEGRATGGS